jgi:hypothetical protein
VSYEYLAASLPMLFFGDPPPFSTATFRASCVGLLSVKDQATLDALLQGRLDAAGAFATAWRAYETHLRNQLALARASAYGADPKPFVREQPGFDMDVARSVDAAYSKAHPLERELELDRGRWHTLDDLARQDPFGAAGVLAFALKLRIAERWDGLSKETGRDVLEQWIRAASGEKAEPEEPGEKADNVPSQSA